MSAKNSSEVHFSKNKHNEKCFLSYHTWPKKKQRPVVLGAVYHHRGFLEYGPSQLLGDLNSFDLSDFSAWGYRHMFGMYSCLKKLILGYIYIYIISFLERLTFTVWKDTKRVVCTCWRWCVYNDRMGPKVSHLSVQLGLFPMGFMAMFVKRIFLPFWNCAGSVCVCTFWIEVKLPFARFTVFTSFHLVGLHFAWFLLFWGIHWFFGCLSSFVTSAISDELFWSGELFQLQHLYETFLLRLNHSDPDFHRITLAGAFPTNYFEVANYFSYNAFMRHFCYVWTTPIPIFTESL